MIQGLNAIQGAGKSPPELARLIIQRLPPFETMIAFVWIR
jgi:hypothetical protein